MSTESAIASSNILVNSGLNFEVEKRPHYVRTVTREGDVFSKSAMSSGIFRTDTGDEIGDVKHTYEPAQTAEILRPFLMAANEGYMTYKSGRAIENGRRFCLTFNIGGLFETHGEKFQKQVIVGGSHDGSWSTFIKSVVMRQVCSNGLLGLHKTNNQFKIRHTTNWKTRYDDVLCSLEKTERYFAEAFAKYNALFDITLTREIRALLTKQLLDIPVVSTKGEKVSTRKQNQFEKIMLLSERGRGIRDNAEILNTGAAWFNAVAEYVDHYCNETDKEKQYVSAFFGYGENRKEKAFDLLQTV
jgi:phage/plasmid-like protein (TIGR03299 family)